MPPGDPAARRLVLDLLEPALRQNGLSSNAVDDSLNVIDRGIVDSLQFLELVARLEDRAGVTLDLFDVDPDVLTTVGGLVALVEDAAPSLPPSPSRRMSHE